jgi:hypothetical protein
VHPLTEQGIFRTAACSLIVMTLGDMNVIFE